MQEKLLDVKKGQHLLFSEGCYSDYGCVMLAKALRDFSDDEIKSLSDEIEQKDLYEKNIKVLVLLLTRGFVEQIDVTEIHLGDYSSDEIYQEDELRGYYKIEDLIEEGR